MIFREASLPGVYVIDLEPMEDSRGFFSRGWCRKEFEKNGLTAEIKQINVSYNRDAGTLRGLHLQQEPFAEAKTVRCTSGAIFDVAVDMREASPGYLQWCGIELSASNHRSLYVPEGFAHGYLTLTPDTEVMYGVSEFYAPGAESGMRYDDPAIGIRWPAEVVVISDKDAAWPFLSEHRTATD
jgi:dTDP-4-dehydrorhamnose 3,5-epimerase